MHQEGAAWLARARDNICQNFSPWASQNNKQTNKQPNVLASWVSPRAAMVASQTANHHFSFELFCAGLLVVLISARPHRSPSKARCQAFQALALINNVCVWWAAGVLEKGAPPSMPCCCQYFWWCRPFTRQRPSGSLFVASSSRARRSSIAVCLSLLPLGLGNSG